MDERLAYLFEANRRRLRRLRRIVIVLAILLVAVVCIAVALAVILLQLKLESLIAESKYQKHETDGSITRPEKLTRVVFAINVVGKKNGRTKDDHRRLSASVIRSVVSKRSSDGTEFALQKYSVPDNTTFTMFSNPYKILRLLDAAMDLDFPFDNPNQTDAILQYRNEYGDSIRHPYQYSYVLFAADPSTYTNPLVYEKDMRDSNGALNRISAAKNRVVVVGDLSVFSATDAAIISSEGTVDEITSRINNHLSSLASGSHVDDYRMERPSTSSKTYPPSIPANIGVAPLPPHSEPGREHPSVRPTQTDKDKDYPEPVDAHIDSSERPTNTATHEQSSDGNEIRPWVDENKQSNTLATHTVHSQRTQNVQGVVRPTHFHSDPPTIPEGDLSQTSSYGPTIAPIPEPSTREIPHFESSDYEKPLSTTNHIPSSRVVLSEPSRPTVKLPSLTSSVVGKNENLSGREHELLATPRVIQGNSNKSYRTQTNLRAPASLEDLSTEITSNVGIIFSTAPASRTNMSVSHPESHAELGSSRLGQLHRTVSASEEASSTVSLPTFSSPRQLPITTTAPVTTHFRVEPSVVDENRLASTLSTATGKEEAEGTKQLFTVREGAELSEEIPQRGIVEKTTLENEDWGEATTHIKTLTKPSPSATADKIFLSSSRSSTEEHQTENISESHGGNGRVSSTTYGSRSFGNDQDIVDATEDGTETSSTSVVSETARENHPEKVKPPIPQEGNTRAPESSSHSVLHSTDNEFTKSTELESLSSDSSTSHTGYRTTGSSENSDVNSPIAAGLPMSSTAERPKDDQHSQSSDEASLAESETTSHSTSTPSAQTTDHVYNASDEHRAQNYQTTENDFDSEITSKASAGASREEEENNMTTIRAKSNLLEPENIEGERATAPTISENPSDRNELIGATPVSKTAEADEFSAEFPDITNVHNEIATKLPLAEADEFSGETPGSHEINNESIADKAFQIDSKIGATVSSEREGGEHRSSSLLDERRGTTLKTRTESVAKHNEDISEESRSENQEQRAASLSSAATEKENLSTMIASVDSRREKGSVRSDMSLTGSNRNVDSLSTSSTPPSELLEKSEEATKETNRFENGNDERTSVPSSSAKSGIVDRIISATASNVEKAFFTVNDEQDHLRTTHNEDSVNTDGFESPEQPSREVEELITTDPNQPATTGLNVQEKDENESSSMKTKQGHAVSPSVRTSSKKNRHLGNEHSREQTAPHFDGRSTLAEESFSTETVIASTLPSEETVEGTTEPFTENAASIVTTPHTFEVSISVNDATEAIETFVTATSGTSPDAGSSSEDIRTTDRSAPVTSSSFSGPSFPSLKEQHTSLNSGALTHDSEPIDAKGANEITFVNIPSTPEEFLEMPRAESGEALVNVENRRSFIETSRHTMRVWPSGKAMSKTMVQNSDLNLDFNEDERSILPEITTTSAEHSSAHDFDIQVTESASQTSAILPNRGKIEALLNHATAGEETETFDEQTKEHIDAASSRVPLFSNVENAAVTSPNTNTIQSTKTDQQGGSAEKLGRDGEVSSLDSQSTFAIADQMKAVLNSRPSRLQNQHYESLKTAITTPATILEGYSAVSPASEVPSSTASFLVAEENNLEVNTFRLGRLIEDHKGTSSGVDFDKTANGRVSSANAELQAKHSGGVRSITAHNKVATDRSDIRERFHPVMSALPLVSDVHTTKTFENAKGTESDGSSDLTLSEEPPSIAINKMISKERVETGSLSDATKAHGAYLGGTMHQGLQKGNRKGSLPSSREDEEAKSGGLMDFPSFRSRNFDNSMSSRIPSNEVLELLSGTDHSSLPVDVADSSPNLPTSAYGPLSTQHPEKQLKKSQADFAESAKQAKQNSTRRISLSEGSVYPCVVDLIIAIDYGPSITDNRENTARFIRRIISNWTLSDSAIRVAIVSYGLDDGVGIYLDGFTNSRTEAAEALKYSLESGGGGVGVVYPLSRLFKSLYMEYSTPRNLIRFDDDSSRKDSRVRDNTRVIFLIFSDSSNTADIGRATKNGLCSKMFHDCRVLMVEMENAADLSTISQPASATLRISHFTDSSLQALNSFIVENMCT